MIARIVIPLLLLIILPLVYIDLHYLHRRLKWVWWKRLLWALPGLFMAVYTIDLAIQPDFIPKDRFWIDAFLLLLGIYVVPKAVFAGCSCAGWLGCRLLHRKKNYGNLIGLILAFILPFVYLYGSTVGFRALHITRIDLPVRGLPAAFNGYRIVQFSDVHVGTFTGSRAHLLQRDVDSINAQKPDVLFFTGDLQNTRPSELYPHMATLSKLHANDGIYSVLGNHDYSLYLKADDAIKVANEREMVSRQQQMGWTVLNNSHATLRRGLDSILVVGTENDAPLPFPAKADLKKALQGIRDTTAFKILLQHDPSSWGRHVLPQSNIQLTLSGHTHGGQMSLFGLRPSQWRYRQDFGLYERHGRYLYVTAGIGGVVPFRLGSAAEIVVITLHQAR